MTEQGELLDVIEKKEKAKKESKPHHLGHRERLRKRFLKSKKGTLPDYELLEMLLFASHPRKDTKPFAKALIAEFGSFAKVITAEPAVLLNLPGINEGVLASFRMVHETTERLLKEEIEEKPILQSWKALLDYCRASMGHLKKEQFRILFMDKKLMVIADELQEVGTVDQTPVYPREIAKRALELEASAIIMVHNHPSGNTEPSKADILLTRKIMNTLEPLGVTLHDHVIIGSRNHYSFKSNGVI